MVRRAKQIARSILWRASAACVGNYLSNDENNTGREHNDTSPTLGDRVNRRRTGASGVKSTPKKRRTEYELLNVVGEVATKLALS